MIVYFTIDEDEEDDERQNIRSPIVTNPVFIFVLHVHFHLLRMMNINRYPFSSQIKNFTVSFNIGDCYYHNNRILIFVGQRRRNIYWFTFWMKTKWIEDINYLQIFRFILRFT